MSLPSPADLRDRLRARIAHQCGIEPDDAGPAVLRDDTPLITGGLLDSIRLLYLLMWVNDEFGVYLLPGGMDEATEYYDTIGTISRLIEATQRTEGAASWPSAPPEPSPATSPSAPASSPPGWCRC